MDSNNFLTRKLLSGVTLSESDISRLNELTDTGRNVPAGEDMISEGTNPAFVHFIRSGAACRYKVLEDGKRAIVALLLPGDFCDLHVDILGHMDHSIAAMIDCGVTRIRADELTGLLKDYPAIQRGFLWATLVDEAILREWIVNIGSRHSEAQLAHLFCELYVRMDAIGLTTNHSFRMPFTHGTLGDLLGISTVHVQRMMSLLRERGLISQQGDNLRLPDFAALARLGGFDAGYLHRRRSQQTQ